MVFQWPCGTEAFRRSPRGAQALSGAMLVLVQVSSMNTRIRPLLGHQSFGVAERHYIKASMIEAGRTYSALLDQLREADP